MDAVFNFCDKSFDIVPGGYYIWVSSLCDRKYANFTSHQGFFDSITFPLRINTSLRYDKIDYDEGQTILNNCVCKALPLMEFLITPFSTSFKSVGKNLLAKT